jgi:hypothetical protein
VKVPSSQPLAATNQRHRRISNQHTQWIGDEADQTMLSTRDRFDQMYVFRTANIDRTSLRVG